MTFFDSAFLFIIIKITLAMLLGLLLGLERVHAHKTAGMRTYALVSVASASFIIVSLAIGEMFPQFVAGFNPAFVAGNIIVGIGFLGAGLIIFKDGHVENLTTAAGMWVCASIGIAVGFGMFKEAIFLTFLTFIVLGVLSIIERYVRIQVFPDPALEQSQKPKRARKARAERIETAV